MNKDATSGGLAMISLLEPIGVLAARIGDDLSAAVFPASGW